MAEDNDNTQLALNDGAAALPATADSETSLADPDMMERDVTPTGPLGGMDIARQLILVAAVAICISLVVLLFMWVQEPEMRPLGTYETEELIPVLDHLDQQKIDYTLDGNTIRVPAKDYSSIKLNLSRAGLNSATEEGDDILMQDMGFGVSQQLERERLKLSRERQLAAAIEKIRAVSKARVLLAMPKQSVFVRHNQEASATVFLTVRGTTQLGQEEVDSIVDMVASAVPSLKPSRVTVTDQHGRLLSSGSQDPIASQRRKEYELERKQEQALREKIDAILIPVLGLGNYTSQVDVTMDFSAVEETRKRFDPATPSTRSEYTRENYNNTDYVAGVPGALSNQPPVDSSIPEDIQDLRNGGAGDKGSLSREATRNYELDTTISHRRGQTGTIARQTVSVAVDYIASTNPETGEITRTPVSDAELEKIRRLLVGGVGYTENRGDILEVLAVPFVEPEVVSLGDVPIWEHENFNDWVRWLAASLVIIVVVLVLIRPAMSKLINPTKDDDALLGPNGEMLGPDGLPLSPDDDIGLIGADLDGSNTFGMSSSNLNLPDLHKDEDLLKAVRALVANEPDLAAQVVKSWVSNDG
ncbi:flagellar basal body M-ring protein FliF [Grimontia hollisae]|uniref:Flagellar M-ring protein n=2 Tax=Grimontia hollisae TaxID=673 RepID=D0ICA1_GRIHO|nr:flagellar basal-body MS-ring/collar protein FliF [Grimontia hollisae]AMG29894.1 flagellar basal body M-ring protein FliF [Grimontia hollisae]EEY71519.1 flagellar M-ring protein FliF [Grimontia hollisae CIP 101886]MDF2185558.1 flagellar basal-body MS-ring/collar protein FliF [Grimontia hollisae]STO43111.1 Flagellar M-ring protein [Grimontia hollisae]STO56805.1 Flagellar M-ring protein [Grimontia hollisae]